MKSNHERSNECLPPKKREILASDLPAEEKPQAAAPASESQRGENLAWLASVAGGQHAGTPPRSDGSLYNPSTEYSACSSSFSSSSSYSRAVVTSLPYTSALSQPGGTIQYTQLPPNLHFINSAYAGPYAGYISSHLGPPVSASAPPSRARQEAYAQASAKAEQRGQLTRSPAVSEGAPHYVHVASSSSPLSVTTQAGSSHHLPLHLHSHTLLPQGLALGGAPQFLLQYSPQDRPAKKEDGRSREALNGEMEAGRHYGLLPDSVLGKQSAGAKAGSSHHHQQQHPQHHHQQQQHHHYEARQVLIPADQAQETSGLRTPLMLVSNSHGDARGSPEKPPPTSSATAGDRGGICLGKPVSRASPFAFPAPQPCVTVSALSPHSVIHTTHSTSEPVSVGLTSNSFYPPAGPPPIIGYIAGGQQQPPVGYHAGLAPQLVFPGGQPMIIPVSTGAPAHTAAQQLVTSAVAKCEAFQGAGPYHAAAVVQAQLHVPAGALASTPPPPSAPSLPPYFMKGSIIQLADGELKRVEDLRTEDFLQSAEISSELKIDSSTVERIDGSPTPNFAIVQFAVGEHRAQVSVEVLVEYPFFVFGKGWSSCCPDRTTQLFELACSKLSVGDVCISLTLKSLRNGSKKAQSLDAAAGNGGLLLRPPKARGGHHGEQENGLGRRAGPGGGGVGGSAQAENGELSLGEKAESGATARPAGRKRRWSAPESRKVERVDEEPPLTLPKPSFITQEVKICIEGRSNIGK